MTGKKVSPWCELMLVVVIIGILAGVVLPRLAGRRKIAEIAKAKSDISAFGTALELYELDSGDFPTTDEGLDALISEPSSADNWNGPYLKKTKIPKDPWGNPYQYVYPGVNNPDYDLLSYGPNGIEGDDDDVVNWEKDEE